MNHKTDEWGANARPPSGSVPDLELEEDETTTVLPLRWPEPPRSLSSRPTRTDGTGLSRTIALHRERSSLFRRVVITALVVGAVTALYLRARRLSQLPWQRPTPPVVASPPPLPRPAPLQVIVNGGATVTKPAIAVSNLPPAPSAPRPRPPAVKPAPRGPSSDAQRSPNPYEDLIVPPSGRSTVQGPP